MQNDKEGTQVSYTLHRDKHRIELELVKLQLMYEGNPGKIAFGSS